MGETNLQSHGVIVQVHRFLGGRIAIICLMNRSVPERNPVAELLAQESRPETMAECIRQRVMPAP